MRENKHDIRVEAAKLARLCDRIDLKFAKILNHFGIPDVTDEEVDKILAEEGITPPCQGTNHHDRPSIHRRGSCPQTTA